MQAATKKRVVHVHTPEPPSALNASCNLRRGGDSGSRQVGDRPGFQPSVVVLPPFPVCYRWGNLGSAKADAQRAIDIDPHHIKAYFRRAAAYKQV